MAVAPASVVLLLLAAAAAVEARPQENSQARTVSSTSSPSSGATCTHPRLLAGIEAAAQDLPEISSFITAAKITGLLDTVFAYHRYTLLAPSNEAWDSLAQSMGLTSAQQLLVQEQKPFLEEVIRLHFGVGGARFSSSLQQGTTTMLVFAPDKSLQASSTTDGLVTFMGPINQAAVLVADVALCNSVMHVVDAVVVPAAELEQQTTGASRQGDAASTAEL